MLEWEVFRWLEAPKKVMLFCSGESTECLAEPSSKLLTLEEVVLVRDLYWPLAVCWAGG